MTIPDSWEARHGAIAEGIEVWLTDEVEDGFGPNVNVLTQATGDMTLDEYTEMSIANAPGFVKDFEVTGVAHLNDATGVLWRRFGITQQSLFVLIDRTGKVTGKGFLDNEQFPDKVAALAAG